MNCLKAKKRWGQHFLHDKNIAQKIVTALSRDTKTLIEVGPGRGVLTAWLVQQHADLYLVEVDPELAAYLRKIYPLLQERIITADFLQLALSALHSGPLAIIGNFPYNISSSLFFKVLTHRQQVQEVVGVVQKEVAERLTAPSGSRKCGMLSVLLQAFYSLEYLFTIPPKASVPPPKVSSAVIRLRRNSIQQLDCDEEWFCRVVKTGFQQRRKTLRNALKTLLPTNLQQACPLLDKRAEQLTVAEFVALTQLIV